LFFITTAWGAKGFTTDLGVPPERIRVVRWGANLDRQEVPARGTVLGRTRGDRLRLLFVGKEGKRKGLDIVLETLTELNRQGVASDLVVCGCQWTGSIPAQARILGLLDINVPAQREQLRDAYQQSDLFFMPTRAETYGMVCCEAAAYGLPAVTTDVGGVAEVVQHNRTGLVLPLAAGPREYAAAIRDLWLDEQRYRQMVVTARDAYESELNWDTWGRKVAAWMVEDLQSLRGGR